MHHNGNLIVKRVIFGYHYSSFPNKYRSLVEEVFDFFLCTQTPYIYKKPNTVVCKTGHRWKNMNTWNLQLTKPRLARYDYIFEWRICYQNARKNILFYTNYNGNYYKWGTLHAGNNYTSVKMMKNKCYMIIGKTTMGFQHNRIYLG